MKYDSIMVWCAIVVAVTITLIFIMAHMGYFRDTNQYEGMYGYPAGTPGIVGGDK